MLTKQLRATLMLNRNIYISIAIIIAHDSRYYDFKTKRSSLLEIGNKTIDKIQQIFYFAKAKNLSKLAIGVINNLTILFKWFQRGYNNYLKRKQKANSNE